MNKNIAYLVGCTAASTCTLGYIIVDNYLLNAKRNRYKWIQNNPSEHIYHGFLYCELCKLDEWEKAPVLLKIKTFWDLPKEHVLRDRN